MTAWHEPREHCYCRQCNAVRVKEEIARVGTEHKEAQERKDGMHVFLRTDETM